MVVQTQLVTAEELARAPAQDARLELIRGEIITVSPTGFRHSKTAWKVAKTLGDFVEAHDLGYICIAELGFVLARDPDLVRVPDVAFVAKERAEAQTNDELFFEGAPDLAVEIVSPSDRSLDVEEKVVQYLNAGARAVWVFYPRTRRVYDHRSPTNLRVLGPDDTLEGGDVLPGFKVKVSDLFE